MSIKRTTPTINAAALLFGILLGAIVALSFASTTTTSTPPTFVPAHVKVAADHYCKEEGRDCIDWLTDAGAYCSWASGIAAFAAFERKVHDKTLDSLVNGLQLKYGKDGRWLTDKEIAHTRYWLTYGWNLGEGLIFTHVQEAAYSACRKPLKQS